MQDFRAHGVICLPEQKRVKTGTILRGCAVKIDGIIIRKESET